MTKTRAYRGLLLACLWASTMSSLTLVFVFEADAFASIAVVCGVLGFFLTAIQAIALETVVEVTYPVSENVSGGIVLGVAVAIYCVQPFVVDALLKQGAAPILWGQFALLAATSLLLTCAFKPAYKRTLYLAKSAAASAPVF